MLKKNKWTILITSLLILLPIAAGLILWDQIPESVPVHWDFQGNADGYASRPVAVFGMPLLILAIHWLSLLTTALDPKHKNIEGKPLKLVLMICPVVSMLVAGVIYAHAMGLGLQIEMIVPFVLGILFLIIGNYLPKCRQNYSIGIKVSWTLNDEENWNHTHRFAGKITTVGSFIVMFSGLLGNLFLMLGAVIVMALLPILYSYLYYRKHQPQNQ